MKQYQIDRIKQNYPVGTRVELTSPMSGEKGMPAGLQGVVTYVDDIGSVGVDWSNGRTLSLIVGEDSFEKLSKYAMQTVSAEEKSLFYSSDTNDAERGCVGHFRADFGGGKEFHSTWWPHNDDAFNTPAFKADLQMVVDDLMKENGLLKDRSAMAEYCRGCGQPYLQSVQRLQTTPLALRLKPRVMSFTSAVPLPQGAMISICTAMIKANRCRIWQRKMKCRWEGKVYESI